MVLGSRYRSEINAMSNKIYLPRKDEGRRKKTKTEAAANAMQKSHSAPLISLAPGPDIDKLEAMLTSVITERIAGISISATDQDSDMGSRAGAKINQVSVASSSPSPLAPM